MQLLSAYLIQCQEDAVSPSLLFLLDVGHGADVKCCDWHPRKSLLVSGSKDNQQPVKVWDSRTGQSICTMSVRDSVAFSMSVYLRILCQLFHLSILTISGYSVQAHALQCIDTVVHKYSTCTQLQF